MHFKPESNHASARRQTSQVLARVCPLVTAQLRRPVTRKMPPGATPGRRGRQAVRVRPSGASAETHKGAFQTQILLNSSTD